VGVFFFFLFGFFLLASVCFVFIFVVSVVLFVFCGLGLFVFYVSCVVGFLFGGRSCWFFLGVVWGFGGMFVDYFG